MKILCLSNNNEIIGGADRVFKNEALLLARNGHEVITFSTSKKLNGFIERDKYLPNEYMTTFFDYHNRSIPSKLINITNFFYRSDVARDLEECISIFKPDIAHLHIIYGQLSNSILKVLKKNRIKIVMTIHDYRLVCPASTMLNPNGEICSKCADRSKVYSVLKKCGGLAASIVNATEASFRDLFYSYQEYVDHFIFVSRFCYDLHIKFFPEISKKSSVINNFADISNNKNKKIKINNKSYVYFGRLAREKGLDTLCDAFIGFDRRLTIIGTGPEEERLKKKYFHFSNIEFKGFLEKEKLGQSITNCTFSILPSEWYENYPMSVLESYIFGLPVIAAEIGGIPEMIENGVTGFLYSSGNKKSLIKVLNNADSIEAKKINEIAIMGLNYFKKNNSSELHLKKLNKLYEKLMSKEGV